MKICTILQIFFYIPIDVLVTSVDNKYTKTHLYFAIAWFLLYFSLALFCPWFIKFFVSRYKKLDSKIKVHRIIFAIIFLFGPVIESEIAIMPYKSNPVFPGCDYELLWVAQHNLLMCLPVFFFIRNPKYQMTIFSMNYLYYFIRINVFYFHSIGEVIKCFSFSVVIILMILTFLSFREKTFKENFNNYNYIKNVSSEWKSIFNSLPQTSVILSKENREILYSSNNMEIEDIVDDYENLKSFIHNKEIISEQNKEDKSKFIDLERVLEKISIKRSYDSISKNMSVSDYQAKFCFYSNENEDVLYEVKIIPIEFDERECFLFLIENISVRNTIHVLKKNNEFKNRFISSFSHELKTPINGSKITIEDCLDSPEASEYLKKQYLIPLNNTIKFLECVVNDMVDFGTISTNQFQLFLSNINFKEFAKEIKEMVEPMALIKNLNLKIILNTNDIVKNDKERLMQVVLNIIRNGIKFSKNGEVILKISKEIFEEEIEVNDTGIGMSQEQQDELKKILSLHSLSNISFNLVSGGIGLIMSQNIVKKIGSSKGINFESIENIGSKFWFYINNIEEENIDFDSLPEIKSTGDYLIEKKTQGISNRKLQIRKCNCPKVLIVDDEPFNLLALENLLKSLNVSFRKAFNGLHAKEIIEEYLIDEKCQHCLGYELILMDLQMPEIDGIHATRSIKELEKKYNKKSISIVACTAFNSKMDYDNCFDVGMEGFLNKPVSKEKLLDTLKKFVRNFP